MPSVSELATSPVTRRSAIGVLAVVGLLYPWLAPNTYLLYAGVLTLMYAVLATSWNLIGGFTGYISLGHAAFYGLGAYGTAILILDYGMPHVPALALSMLGTVVFAAIVGLAAVRARGASFVIVSIALVTMMSLIAQDWRDLTGGSFGLRPPRFSEDMSREDNHLLFFYLFAGVLVLALLTWWFIDRSRFGAGLKAIREDEDKAEALGVPTTAYKVVVYALSAGFTGLAGGLYGIWYGHLDPVFLFSILVGANMVLMALLGGVRHLFGPMLGALIVAPTGEYFLLRFSETQLHLVLSGALLGIVVLFMPGGIIPAVQSLLRRFGPTAASIREESQEEIRERLEAKA